MNSDEIPPTVPPLSRVPQRALLLMAFVLIAMALLSVFANYEKRHVDQIEKVSITDSPPPSAAPLASPSPEE